MTSAKCEHVRLVVHGDGAWFYAECADCGMIGPKGKTPLDARMAFDKRRGKRKEAPCEASLFRVTGT